MSVVVLIKNADFSENCIGTLTRWNEVVSENKSASEGEIATSVSSMQTRIWIPLPSNSIAGKSYKAVLSVTNGSGVPSTAYTDLCSVRFVQNNTARTGQDIIPTVPTASVPDLTAYTVENTVACNGTYTYLYVYVTWDAAQPTKYPDITITLYIYQ